MAGEHGHPSSWRLHRAHPAIGLEEIDGQILWPLKASELGVAWLALPAHERRLREADFEAALCVAAGSDSGWELELMQRTTEPHVLGVTMDRWKAPALQRELLDQVWEAARRREQVASRAELERRRSGALGRRLRAHAHVAWSKRPIRIVLGSLWLLGLVGLHPLGWL